MQKFPLLFSALLLVATGALAQSKKPLDHSVYDGWQSVSGTQLSNDGNWVVFQVNPQEGDGELIVRSTDGAYTKVISRGYNAVVTEDNRFVVFKIRPWFKETRDARIKKKRPDDMPKDSLGMLELGKDSVWKVARVKSFKVPDQAGGWMAYLLEKPLPETPRPPARPDSLTRLNRMVNMADSLARVADSLRNKAQEARQKGMSVLETPRTGNQAASRPAAGETVEEGTVLVVRNLATGEERRFELVSEYQFSKNGNALVVETTRKNADTITQALVLWVHTGKAGVDTVMRKFNDAKNYAFDEEGAQLAFVAERDSVAKALRKYYKLWYFQPGMDSATVRAARGTNGVPQDKTVSPDYPNKFSKNGTRLFLGLAPVRQPKDTTLVDFETARLDIWHYNDDYLQPQQLVQLNGELRRSYLTVLHKDAGVITPLADEDLEAVETTDDDNGPVALGRTSKGYRVEGQWSLRNAQDIYLVDVKTGSRKLIARKIRGGGRLSPKGNYVYWYDWTKRHYMIYDVASGVLRNATQKIAVPLWDEEDDHPDDPPPHGFMGWQENDAFFFVYDRFDIWRVDPKGINMPVNLTNGTGRRNNLRFRFVNTDREERFLRNGQAVLLSVFDTKEKGSGITLHKLGEPFVFQAANATAPHSLQGYFKAKHAPVYGYLKGSFNQSNNVTVFSQLDSAVVTQGNARGTRYTLGGETTLSQINPQQKSYNWFTVELHRWKMFDGKMSEGLLFKPENFDSTKKYPVIFYFYERNSDNRYNYRAPAPSASTVNIPYFVSNGYLVFDPNIYYKNGEPGESAYNSIVSAARYLSKMKWVDSTKMAIQGQSWGGYQVAYLITRTNLFAAAGAGAPVANMFSAYGGIRWGTGISRQFQYEKSQSRIGYTPWQRPDLYTKNSPLFKADKVRTPLLLMHNDKDGAVPWYQGIEYFTALRRLGQKVWMLQYNDEDHNLVERRNRKDLSVRLGQFFDHYLKGAPMPVWMKEGVPAVNKGIDWGLDIKE
ncbi:MAG TPA: prolyl oligopeptidase family serine peptidase [Lacibacter sp.]|nr:prolyl oligopeptidase family serine peptidase [Lacibacter sp.]HMO89654.1 prolyl oligopeptidase family serine peptidase [Lacibacter sp.]